MPMPVVAGAASLLFHAPGLVRHGSKPSRDARGRSDVIAALDRALRPYKEVVGYPPNQVFIGNLSPWELHERARPWFTAALPAAQPHGRHGMILTEDALYTALLAADTFNLVYADGDAPECVPGGAITSLLTDEALEAVARRTRRRSRPTPTDLPLVFGDGRPFAWVRADHDDDASLFPDVLLENLLGKATGAVVLRFMLEQTGIALDEVDYVISCSEEAVGDRYQRGGGNLGKAIAELAGCRHASGADVKNFCAGPVVGIVMASSLVQAGVFRRVAVIGGASLPKLGMKYGSHLAKGLPILEDVLGATAVLIQSDDGESPHIRLDSVGTARVKDETSPIGLMDAVVRAPLQRLQLGLRDVDRYIGELHNPEITIPAGGGDVPDKNYRMIAASGVAAGELSREELSDFVRTRGVPGFAPTQGHVASAICFMPQALALYRQRAVRRTMFIAKASCFLGRMTQLQDAISFLMEAR